MATSKMTAKGQITIPKALRKRLDLHPGDAVEIIEVGDPLSPGHSAPSMTCREGLTTLPGHGQLVDL